MPRFSADHSVVVRAGICLGLLLVLTVTAGCSVFSTPSAATRPLDHLPHGSAKLLLLNRNPNVYQLTLSASVEACEPVFATALEQCHSKDQSSPTTGSVAKLGLARQLLIGFDKVTIHDRGTVDIAARTVAWLTGGAQIDGHAVLFTGATLVANGCTRDYVFWSRSTASCQKRWGEIHPLLIAVVAEQERVP